jgi:hypothetical protein
VFGIPLSKTSIKSWLELAKRPILQGKLTTSLRGFGMPPVMPPEQNSNKELTRASQTSYTPELQQLHDVLRASVQVFGVALLLL